MQMMTGERRDVLMTTKIKWGRVGFGSTLTR
jgi:hypothetical protein